MEIISREETHKTIAIIDANTIQNTSKQILACCGQERNHKIQNYFQVFDQTYISSTPIPYKSRCSCILNWIWLRGHIYLLVRTSLFSICASRHNKNTEVFKQGISGWRLKSGKGMKYELFSIEFDVTF